jgi:hypothetical protein
VRSGRRRYAASATIRSMSTSDRRWVGGRVKGHAELGDADESFWRDAGYAARFEASIELSLSLHRLRQPDEPAPRFGRDAFGVRRR